MSRKVIMMALSLTLSCMVVSAQQQAKLLQRAQTQVAAGRYQEAFELLRDADHAIVEDASLDEKGVAAWRYKTAHERLGMYIQMHRSDRALEQIGIMERHATASGDERIKNDLLYNKAIYYYTYGMNAQGNAVFKEMADKLTASKDYDKIDEVYQTLIANGRRSNNANMVAQSYSNYIAWKDSTSAIKHADEINALKKQIADDEAAIQERDSSLTTRWIIIVGLGILAAALAAALIVGAIILMRFILQTRKQKKVIKLANESNALKAKFISNISAQLEPTFKKLDSRQPEVKALLDFSNHIQTLSELENKPAEEIVFEDVAVQPFCESLMDSIRSKAKSGVTLNVTAQKMTAPIYKEYVSHILQHLLENAAIYTPEGGTIHLEFKKRGPHSYQFLVSDTGCGIAEERREDVFKPFLEIHDLTEGDGLGLPICKQMALKMNGDLEIDPQYTKGTRFILDLHS